MKKIHVQSKHFPFSSISIIYFHNILVLILLLQNVRQRSKSPAALTGRQDFQSPLTVVCSCGKMAWGGGRGSSCSCWCLIFQTVVFPQAKGHVIRGMFFLNFCSYLIGAGQGSQGGHILECPVVCVTAVCC